MKKILAGFACGMVLFGMTGVAVASSSNMAEGGEVTLDGSGFFNSGGWWGSIAAAPLTVTDGNFLSDWHAWNQNTVFWSSTSRAETVTIELMGGFANITSITLQADNNDQYGIQYRDINNDWNYLATIDPLGDTPWWGMAKGYATLTTPVVANAFRIQAVGGDGWYSISEFQAMGTPVSPVPVPGAVVLLGSGLAGLIGISRRKQQ